MLCYWESAGTGTKAIDTPQGPISVELCVQSQCSIPWHYKTSGNRVCWCWLEGQLGPEGRRAPGTSHETRGLHHPLLWESQSLRVTFSSQLNQGNARTPHLTPTFPEPIFTSALHGGTWPAAARLSDPSPSREPEKKAHVSWLSWSEELRNGEGSACRNAPCIWARILMDSDAIFSLICTRPSGFVSARCCFNTLQISH